jgi:hypothetical protein
MNPEISFFALSMSTVLTCKVLFLTMLFGKGTKAIDI